MKEIIRQYFYSCQIDHHVQLQTSGWFVVHLMQFLDVPFA